MVDEFDDGVFGAGGGTRKLLPRNARDHLDHLVARWLEVNHVPPLDDSDLPQANARFECSSLPPKCRTEAYRPVPGFRNVPGEDAPFRRYYDQTMLRLPRTPSHNGSAHHPRFAAVRRPLTAAVAVLVLGAIGSVGGAQAANAATLSCDTPSLISAIATANGTPGGSTLVLATGCVYTLASANNTTEGGTGLPVITGNVTIQGAGATITRSTATGVPAFRLFDVASGGSLTLNSLTLSNGLANNGQQGGGAIFSHGTLAVTSGTFTNNSSPATTGTSGGAIDSSGTLTVDTSTFSGNSAQEGGGVFNQASATITNSTFTSNNATIYGGGALLNAAGTETLVGDTFVGNTGPGGGAIDNDTTLNITNSTFYNNTGGTNGGGAVENFGTTTLKQSTFSGNTSPY